MLSALAQLPLFQLLGEFAIEGSEAAAFADLAKFS